MVMTEKNGQPSMEEILASIRRIIAEEPVGAGQTIDFNRRPIMLPQEADGEDGPEFDLPAIFRPSGTQPDKPTPLLGRLTDAIRNATAGAAEPKIGLGAETSFSSAGSTQSAAEPFAESGPHESLSSLKITARADKSEPGPFEPVPIVNEPHAASPAVDAAPKNEGVRRVMSPFKDTKFLRLAGGASSNAPDALEPQQSFAPEVPVSSIPAPMTPEPTPIEPPATQLAPFAASTPPSVPVAPASVVSVDFSAIVPQRLDPGRFDPLRPAATMPLAPPPVQTPAPPLATQASTATGSIEDATADLLRPMLRQWLADNMPRMVEKALHIEVAESVKSARKPPGST